MASNFLDFTDPNDPRFGIDNPYDLYQYYSNPSLTQQTEEENLAPPLTQQTVFNPLTNYFGDDDDEEDDINRKVNTNKNFNSPITMRNALQYGIGTLVNPLLGYAAGKAYDYFNPPTPTMNYVFDGDVADSSTGSYSTNPGIGFSNRDPEDYDPSIGMDDEGLSVTDVESFDREAASEQSDGDHDGGASASAQSDDAAGMGGY